VNARARVGRRRRKDASVTEAGTTARPRTANVNECPNPECGSSYAIKGADLVVTRPGKPEEVVGQMVVCANCGSSYMATQDGPVVPKIAFGYARRPQQQVNTAGPRDHGPGMADGSARDPLKWRRGGV